MFCATVYVSERQVHSNTIPTPPESLTAPGLLENRETMKAI